MGHSMPIAIGGAALQRADAGGHAWALGHWALGMRDAGHEVAFFDYAADDAPRSAAQEMLASAGVGHAVLGPRTDLTGVAADVNGGILLNVMGFLPKEVLSGPSPTRVFLDIDPGYPQMWRDLGFADMFEGHERFVTIGENIGKSSCAIPDCGLDWITTPPPVALSEWPVTPSGTAFSTVATWRNPYGTITWGGQTYGSRVHEFRKFFELPRLVDVEFELALDIHKAETDDLRELDANGWRVVDPKAVAGTPASYRSYVQRARAEFAVAQNIYVATRSGWLSDRSLCYLASGKPVLAQETGFSDNYPVGEGLLAFTTLEDAAAGVEEIERNYDRHSRAARELAEEFFDGKKVIGRLLEELGVGETSHA